MFDTRSVAPILCLNMSHRGHAATAVPTREGGFCNGRPSFQWGLLQRGIPMSHPQYTKEQIAARGKAIYEQQIRSHVEPEHTGEYLVINIDTGEYEIDKDKAAVSERAYARYPGAPLYGM